jgi:hypothetical protein
LATSGLRADHNCYVPKINMAWVALGAAVLALLGPLPAPGPADPHVARFAVARGWPPVVPGPPIESTAMPLDGYSRRCTDSSNAWLGMRWREPLRWRVNEATIPGYFGDRAAVVAALRSAATTVDTGRNDCGLTGDLGVEQTYLGPTDRRAGVTAGGGCGERDGINTVSFGQLNAGLLAVTCIWWYGERQGGRSVEADILIDDASGLFFLSTPPGCGARWDLEGTITHEFGHAFGLGHVSFTEHGELTMSDGLPDCSTAYRGLGLGDYLALQGQYGLA